MQTLRGRMTYMRWVEAASAFVLPLAFWRDWYQASGHITWELRIAALALVCHILLQGALYWHLKIRSCDRRAPLPVNFHVLFGAFRWSNVLAGGAMLAALLFGLAGSASRVDLAWDPACWPSRCSNRSTTITIN
jgi:hypothetical protein